MLKIWNKFDSYDETKSQLFTWAAAIARHSAIDEVRLKRFEDNQKTDTIDINVYDLNTTDLSSDGIDVQKLLTALEDKYKNVLDLVYLQGYSQSEAAKKLDIPLGTVKTRIKQALRILRGELITEKTLFIGLLFMIFLLLFQHYGYDH